ncbi:MAG: Crp/Fnr family transcriptional regulator [Acidobacteria bacterium]|nr:Crp/Fnr family transcriptional regulator [Acidobacteriota bacterium]
MHTKLWYFERFRLISALNDAQRQQLGKVTRMLEVKRGTQIYLPGDPSDQIFLLKSGVIKISARTLDDRQVILAFLHPGDIFGELAVVDDAPRDHMAEAYDDCVICAMSRDTIMRMIRETPEVGFQITKLIGLRIRTLKSRVEELLCKSAHARVAHALLELADRHGVPDTDGVLISLRLSQGDLGRLVGLSRETVNAILQEWREQNLLEMDRRSVRLRDPERLRWIAAQPATGESSPDSPRRSN